MEITTLGKLVQEIGVSALLIIVLVVFLYFFVKWMSNYLDEQQENYKEDKSELMKFLKEQQEINKGFLEQYWAISGGIDKLSAELKLTSQYQRQEHENMISVLKGIKTRG